MRRLIFACLSVLLLALITACPAPTPEEVPTTPAPPEEVTPPPPAEKMPGHIVIGSRSALRPHQVCLIGAWEKYLDSAIIANESGGVNASAPLLKEGTLDIYVCSTADAWRAYHGIGEFEDIGEFDMLTLWASPSTCLTFFTVPRAGITKLQDCAGKRIAVQSSRCITCTEIGYGALEWAGVLDKVTDYKEVARLDRRTMMVEGKLDMYNEGLGATYPELKSEIPGIMIVPIPEKCGKYLEERFPYVRWKVVSDRWVTDYGIPDGATGMELRMGYYAYSSMDEFTAYMLTKTCWDRYDELLACHPGWKDITLEDAVYRGEVVPYHPGAIKYYKEVGVWSSELDALQEKLLAEQGKATQFPCPEPGE